MDHSPFENLFKSLLPILIFIALAIVSGWGQKKKKTPPGFPRQERGRETNPDQVKRPAPKPIPKDALKRSFEEMLKEMGFPVEREPAPVPTPVPQEKKAPPPSYEEQSLEDLEPEIAPASAAFEKRSTSAAPIPPAPSVHIQTSAGKATQTAPPVAGVAPTMAFLQENAQNPHSAQELQKFVVWSELLGKPLALRGKE